LKRALLAAIALEIVVFGLIAPNFLTSANLMETTRLSVELGLLAVALTPIIVTGGIDLSVGSLLGLSAIVFGVTSRDLHMPIPAAIAAALATGLAGGALNAFLIARVSIPPLIVTLGTMALFRGIAEGVTQAATNYSGFPASFLSFGQGYVGGLVPTQLPVLVVAILAFAVLLHRSVIGRTWYAIGYRGAGIRYPASQSRNASLSFTCCRD
jgi:rhamnose transport system permease protein